MRKRFGALCAVLCAISLGAADARAGDGGPFGAVIGWWSGDGRLGFRNGKTEAVKCRVTYVAGASERDVAQSIRCASPSGKVEIKSSIRSEGRTIAGTWSELVYNLHGDLSGHITDRGFRVTVSAGDVGARMDVIVKDGTQVIEIQFRTETLVGMTLVLKKG